MQSMSAERERIALFDRYRALREIDPLEELRHHLHRACRCDDLHLRELAQKSLNATCVVGLQMVNNEVVGRATAECREQFRVPLVVLARIDRIHHRNFLIENQIGVVRDAVGDDVLALEQIQIGVINTDIFYVSCNIHNYPDFNPTNIANCFDATTNILSKKCPNSV